MTAPWDVELTLPWPPSVNHYYRHVGHKVLISAAGRAYRATVLTALVIAGTKTLSGRLELDIDLHAPTRAALDVDNRQKALFDALQHGGLYVDDACIDRFTVTRREVVRGGKVVVRVRQWRPEDEVPR